MNILLVNPPRFEGMPVIREDRCENVDRDCVQPPTSYVYMASVLSEAGHEVELVDCNAYNISYVQLNSLLDLDNVDAVIFRSTPSTYFHDCRLAEIVKHHNPEVETVMLNWNLNAFSRQALERTPSVDIYVHNYSYENILPSLFDGTSLDEVEGITYRQGKQVVVNPVSRISKVGDIPAPLWSLVPDHSVFYTQVKATSPWAVVRGSKGCGFRCTFCVDRNIPFDPRTPNRVVDEVEDLVTVHGVKYLSFFDNTFTVNKGWAKEICEGIVDRQLKFKWFMNTRAGLVDADLLEAMKQAGLDGVSVGIESGSDHILEGIRKGHTVQDAVDTVRMIRSHGVKTYVSVMMGFPHETKEDMEKTFDLILSTRANGFQISVTIPYPSTPLYDECLREGLIGDELAWNEMSVVPRYASGTIQLSELPNSELKRLRRRFYWKLYFHPKFLFRNMAWTVTHPADLKMAVQYLASSMARLRKGVTFSH